MPWLRPASVVMSAMVNADKPFWAMHLMVAIINCFRRAWADTERFEAECFAAAIQGFLCDLRLDCATANPN